MSHRVLRTLLALCAVLAVGAATATLYAATAEKGSVSGSVTTEAGKPAQGLGLRLDQEVPVGIREGGGNRSVPGAGDHGATGLTQGGTKTIARTTTDKEGKFSFKNIEPGAYIMVGGGKNIGWIYYPVVVQSGQNTDLGEIKLQKD